MTARRRWQGSFGPVMPLLLAGAMASVAMSGAHAQAYPERPIRMVVPYPAGSGLDAAARSIAPRLGERLKQRVIVDNRDGATSLIGTEFAARGAPDGHTLLLASTLELALYPALATRMPYDVVRDFEPVARISAVAMVLVVHPSLPARSVNELVALAKKRPGLINYGSAGIGATSHLTLALLCDMTATDIVHVPYTGLSLAVTDLLGGRLQVMMPPMPSVLPYTATGRLRALAVSTAKRWPAAPDLPTLDESGLPGYEVVLWSGVLAPVNTPQDIVDRLHREIAQVLAAAEVVQAFAGSGAVVHLMNPGEFDAYLKSELRKWSGVGRKIGIRVN